jgi:hypothetical protein
VRKFEYNLATVSPTVVGGAITDTALVQQLNKMDEAGWEVVALMPGEAGISVVLRKPFEIVKVVG